MCLGDLRVPCVCVYECVVSPDPLTLRCNTIRRSATGQPEVSALSTGNVGSGAGWHCGWEGGGDEREKGRRWKVEGGGGGESEKASFEFKCDYFDDYFNKTVVFATQVVFRRPSS